MGSQLATVYQWGGEQGWRAHLKETALLPVPEASEEELGVNAWSYKAHHAHHPTRALAAARAAAAAAKEAEACDTAAARMCVTAFKHVLETARLDEEAAVAAAIAAAKAHTAALKAEVAAGIAAAAYITVTVFTSIVTKAIAEEERLICRFVTAVVCACMLVLAGSKEK